MRLVVPISLSVLLFLSACTPSSTVDAGSDELPDVLPASSDLAPEEVKDSTTTTPQESQSVDPANYLLQAEDLPGWTYFRAMDFAAEPTFETPDCNLMTTAWAAHAAPGTRIRASTDDVSFRQTVVEMPDEASALAIIEAAQSVWQECNPLASASGTEWWVEPIETPEVEGWQTAGLALGAGGDLIWTISWFQQGSTIIFIDLDSENPWTILNQVQSVAIARLSGEPDPTPLRNPTAPTTSRQDWEDHAAAAYIVEPEFFGPEFHRESVSILNPQPANPDEYVAGCLAAPLPTMNGLDAAYENASETADIGVIVGIDNSEWAQDNIDSLRGIEDCDAGDFGFDSFDVIEPETDGDDAVLVDLVVGGVRYLMYVSRYGDTMVAVVVGVEPGSTFEWPTADIISGWASDIAARG